MFELICDFVLESITAMYNWLFSLIRAAAEINILFALLLLTIPELIFAIPFIMYFKHYRNVADPSGNSRDMTLKKLSGIYILSDVIIIICKLFLLYFLSPLIENMIVKIVALFEPKGMLGDWLNFVQDSSGYITVFGGLSLFIAFSVIEIIAAVIFRLKARKSTRLESKILPYIFFFSNLVEVVTIVGGGLEILIIKSLFYKVY